MKQIQFKSMTTTIRDILDILILVQVVADARLVVEVVDGHNLGIHNRTSGVKLRLLART